jgi:DEAD/DEAH box helicase domain-containing protein
MSLTALLAHWRSDPSIFQNITEWRSIPARPARFASLPQDLHPRLRHVLETQGITHLYSHQFEAWEHIKRGRNIVIATGTASGKTLAYNLPTLNRLLSRENSKALYLFPTKALAQDQIKKLKELIDNAQIGTTGYAQLMAENPALKKPVVALYDGDTPASERSIIREKAEILISNPDMLHWHITSPHPLGKLFSNLRLIVIDEIHTYRRVFGSHVANVIRDSKGLLNFMELSQNLFLPLQRLLIRSSCRTVD